MKNVILTALFFAAGAAQAAPLSCTTNVMKNPTLPADNYTINALTSSTVSVTQDTTAGVHIINAPVTFTATIERVGPEVVRYTNEDKGFELVVGFQPIGGSIRGTVTREIDGEKVPSAVICVQAFN